MKTVGLVVMLTSGALGRTASAQVAVAPAAPLTLEAAQGAAGAALVKSREGRTKGNLGALRSALSIYYGDKEGRYPASPAELVPGYIRAIPAASLPGTGHVPSAEVVILTEDVQDYAGLKALGKYAVPSQKANLWLIAVTDCF